jgi:hypothetical protein
MSGSSWTAKLEVAFWDFHHANPLVYTLLVKYARQWARNNEHGSINALFERVRWDYGTTIQPTDGFRLNNNHRAFYARLIETKEADLESFFRLRQQRRQASFGPLNRDLPSGDHVA